MDGNLDLYFTPEAVVKQLFCHYAQGADLALIEGVMGYYDGLGGTSCEASSYHWQKPPKRRCCWW